MIITIRFRTQVKLDRSITNHGVEAEPLILVLLSFIWTARACMWSQAVEGKNLLLAHCVLHRYASSPKSCSARPYTLFAIQLSPSFLRIVELLRSRVRKWQTELMALTFRMARWSMRWGPRIIPIYIGQLKIFACRTPFCPDTCPQNWLFLPGIRTDHPARFDGLSGHMNWPLQCQKRLEIDEQLKHDEVTWDTRRS